MPLFTDPCGTSYVFLENSSIYSDFLVEISKNIFDSRFQKFRLVLDTNPNIQKELIKVLDSLKNDWLIEPYGTTFLVFDLNCDNKKISYNDKKLENRFNVLEINPKDVDNLVVAKNFMTISFGYDLNNQAKPEKITKIDLFFENFRKSQNENDKLKIYLVQEKNTQSWVGCYALYLNNKEIQLHSVAGKALSLKLVQEPKLPTLFQSAIIKSGQFGFKNLTLSSSQTKLVNKYIELGCQPIVSRKCWILEKKLV